VITLDNIGWPRLHYMHSKPKTKQMALSKYFGPSTIVAAAFIGPGTLTTCTLAGVQTGYELIWALLFSTFATLVLQEMAARLGFVTQTGLGEAVAKQFEHSPWKYLVFFLVIGAIVVGNAAYESSNLSGGILGLELSLGGKSWSPYLITGFIALLLGFGKYKWIERLLITLVIIMSICFAITALMSNADWSAVIAGCIPGKLSSNHYVLLMGLIGTTVVPYNLFLHASTISKKYNRTHSLNDIRKENAISICLGGLISILIIITAASTRQEVSQVNNAADLAIQLEPVFGQWAKYLMSIGLIAAGISSAITAPLAAAYAAKGIFGWKDENQIQFKLVWAAILLIGMLVAVSGIKLISIIQFAQITNAVLLPLIACFLLYVCNSSKIIGKYANSLVSNILSLLVILICLLISFKSFNAIFQLI